MELSDLKIGISSNVNFYKKTIPVCVGSIIKSGFNPSSIYVFIGGYDGEYEEIDVGLNVNAYKCPHNSFDFTSVVSIIDLNMTDNNWFILHDTVEVDHNFKDILSSELSKTGKKINRFPSMSMGSYDSDSFSLAKEKINQIRNISKGDGVKMEDVFISHMPSICDGFTPMGLEDVYGNGTKRFIEYYRQAGIKKNKANNGTRSEWVTTL